jgi:hypothetical protein
MSQHSHLQNAHSALTQNQENIHNQDLYVEMTLKQKSNHHDIHTNAMRGIPDISYTMATPILQFSNKVTELLLLLIINIKTRIVNKYTNQLFCRTYFRTIQQYFIIT